MSDTHAHTSHVEQTWFTESEVKGFKSQDYGAGRGVVLLVCAIFSLGVVLYTVVATSVYLKW